MLPWVRSYPEAACSGSASFIHSDLRHGGDLGGSQPQLQGCNSPALTLLLLVQPPSAQMMEESRDGPW